MSENVRTFDRWKYAEEHAEMLHDAGRLVRLTNEHGVENEDHYLTDRFTVEDLGPADPKRMGLTGIYVGPDAEESGR